MKRLCGREKSWCTARCVQRGSGVMSARQKGRGQATDSSRSGSLFVLNSPLCFYFSDSKHMGKIYFHLKA